MLTGTVKGKTMDFRDSKGLLTSRQTKREDTVVTCGGAQFGGGHFCVIAGPCSVENEEEIFTVAQRVRAAGAGMLRGGAFKPRTSPYDFQGLHEEGLSLLVRTGHACGLPVVSEITDIRMLDKYADVDMLQVGARNMQNFDLLRELGHCGKPVLLKRGMCATLDELLFSAEYILNGGNGNVVLCERGIRTFETAARNTLDLAAVPLLHQMSHLPVIVDPSHATGHYTLIRPMSLAAVACGADGLMIEVHNDPDHARSDGMQSLTLNSFDDTMQALREMKLP